MKRSWIILISLLFSAVVFAQSAPERALKGIGYGKMNAPTGDEWQSPESYAFNKEQPKAYFFSFGDVPSATRFLPEHSTYYRSLDGKWRFHWVGNPDERIRDFHTQGYDASTWDIVDVPMNWSVYGIGKDGSQKYGTPIYVNQPAIFYHEVAVDDWRKGIMRTPPKEWTTYKHRNEVGAYIRTFDVPKEWDGREIYLNFDGVDSFFYLWVNGEYVGFSKNSRNLAAFNISPYLIPGENSLAVEVYRSSDGSHLETQDMFRLPGIYRSVYLTAKPKVQIRDFRITPNLDSQYKDGALLIRAEILNLSDRKIKDYSIDYSLYSLPLYSDDATLVEGVSARGTAIKIAKGAATWIEMEMTVPNPRLWSAEAPYRYLIVAQLKDKKGRTVETVSSYTGFREVEIKETSAEEDEFGLAGRYFYVNGKTPKFKGVNRHETNPERGHVVSRDRMEQEVMLMKRANINHVRNSHYPPDPYFFYLCDKYGIYLENEANIESHHYYYGKESLSHVPEFETAHVNRMLEMVHATFNSPSIVIWSLGNEAGPGKTFVKVYKAAKAVDPSRPIQYERNNDIVDIGSNQYPPIPWVEKAATGTSTIKYPFHISEYAHSMGNAAGGLADYWKAIESSNFICGGAIWDWVDQALYNYTPDGTRYLAYGGDFGDVPNNGMFVMNGIVFADLNPKPQYHEVKKVYQHIGFSPVAIEKGEISIFNKHYYTDLSDYTLRWSLYCDGYKVQEGIRELPHIAPRQQATVHIPYDKSLITPESEYFLKVECLLREDKPWAKAGYVQADEQLLIQKSEVRSFFASKQTSHKPLKSSYNGRKTQPFVTVEGADFVVTFDMQQGTIHRLSYSGEEVITEGNGPKISTFRAPCDNDIWAWQKWGEAGLHNLKQKVSESMIVKHKDGSISFIFEVTSQAPNGAKLYDTKASGRYQIEEWSDRLFGEEDFKIMALQTWTVHLDGSIELDAQIAGNQPDIPLARLGYEVIIPSAYSNYTYYGRGPVNNYSDRKDSQFIEVHKSTVAEQFVPFPKPQTMGNREDVRWATLTNEKGKGIAFIADETMSTSALPWGQLTLMMAPHIHELPKAGDIHLHLDAIVTGLGGNSCGQAPPPEAQRVTASPRRFGFIIRSIGKAN